MSFASEVRAWTVALAAVFALSGIGFQAWRMPAVPNLAPSVAQLNTALATINQPCKTGQPCGTLANVDKLTTKSGDIVVTLQQQIQQSGKLVDTSSRSIAAVAASAQGTFSRLDESAGHIDGVLDSSKKALDSASVAMNAVPLSLSMANSLMSQGVNDLSDLDAMLKSKAVTDTASHLAGTMASLDGIGIDIKKVTDKATNDFLTPQPWYKKAGHFASDAFDYGALAARHIP